MSGEEKNKGTVQPLDVFTCGLDGVCNIEASAGTGKTWAICGLYLRLIAEKGLDARQVLVVTFTNAAAAELRKRVRDRLVEVLHAMDTGRRLSADPFVEKFIAGMEAAGGDEIQRMRERLRTALFSFEEAAIFTIHSFCQRTLGEVAFAAVQPFKVEVEQNDDEFIRETAADYWRRIAERYTADEIRDLMARGLKPDWIQHELRRVFGRPLARLLLPGRPPGDRAAGRADLLRKILLLFGPRAVRAAKRRRRVISYNDMLYNLFAALTEGRFPWLAGQLRTRYPAALIDEFQDTDPLQFAIFREICGDSGTLFLVGDPKQAIYSFRSADLNTYLAAKRQAKRQWTLVENQRSEEGLISAVNAVFEANKNAFCSDRIKYRDVKRGARPLCELDGDPEERPALSVWLYDPEKSSRMSVGDAEQLALNATAWEMSRLIAGGNAGRIRIGSEPLQPRNIAVLVRTRDQGRKVKAALAGVGIGSVDLSDRSVFASPEAEEMERVLQAVAEPASAGLVRAALTTVLMGMGSRELAGLNASDEAFNRIIERMDQYQLLWRRHGFGAMWRRLMTEEKVIERLLPRPGGERRITNLMHLMELMASAEERHRGIESLLRWLEEKRSRREEEEAAQLRLESDENLVQIVTKHRAKGLEWPIVFCPFIWKEYGRAQKDDRVYAYHEEDELIIDYTAVSGGKEEQKKGKKKQQNPGKERQEREGREERVRLIYVALTRAINRCYIAAGPFWHRWGDDEAKARDKLARNSTMNWIVSGDGESPDAWAKSGGATIDAMHQSWQKLFAAGQGIGQIPWPSSRAVPLSPSGRDEAFRARAVERLPGASWRLSSFTALSRSSGEAAEQHESEARDYDFTPDAGEDAGQEDVPVRGMKRPSSDIIDFPAGATAGRCIHAVFEQIDFGDETGWDEVINGVLASCPPESSGVISRDHAGMIHGMLTNVVNTPLPGGFALRSVTEEKRFREIEFTFPVARLDHDSLNALLKNHGRRVPRLAFAALEGYLRGFIDLVFEAGGKWYVLDWKSNKLGSLEEEYGRAAVSDAMFSHAYELQGLIYLTALHRYLKLRIPGYDYRTHMGGILYLFVRGVRPEWPSAGIWHDLPEQAMIESMDALFSGEQKREGGKGR